MDPRRLCTLIVVAAAASSALAGAGPPTAAPPPVQDVPPDPNDPDAGKPKAAGADSPPADPAQVARGARLFKDFCQKCHGLDMVSPGPPFFDLRTFPHDDRPRFVDSVTHGKRAMPAWGGVVAPADIDALWAYVASYKPR